MTTKRGEQVEKDTVNNTTLWYYIHISVAAVSVFSSNSDTRPALKLFNLN